jgi:hypothetical protein
MLRIDNADSTKDRSMLRDAVGDRASRYLVGHDKLLVSHIHNRSSSSMLVIASVNGSARTGSTKFHTEEFKIYAEYQECVVSRALPATEGT